MDKRMRAILNMGKHKMKTWWIFGFQWWSVMRPAKMWMRDGRCYVPLFLGLWIRDAVQDRY